VNDAQGIRVQGEGQIAVTPDMASVVLGVELQGEDVGQLRNEANSRMNAVIEGLQADGIPEDDIQTARYELFAMHEPPRPVPDEEPAVEPDEPAIDEDVADEDEVVRYRLVHQVQVSVRDIDATGEIIDNALDNGANSVGHVHFEVEDREGAIQQARENAVENALEQAEHLAELSGVALGQPTHVTESSPSVPPVRPDQPVVDVEVPDEAVAPIEPGENIITVHVEIIYAIN
jgi:uncharacterized protein YggE